MLIQLYDANSIDTMDWPDTEDGHYAKRCLPPFVKKGVHNYINNIHVESHVLKVDDLVLPIIVTDGTQTNSWVCSPYTQYIGYGQEYTWLISNPLLSKLVKNILGAIGRCTQWCKLDAVVYVNNWLFAADLYPKGFSEGHVQAIQNYLQRRFPQHAIVFRSVNPLLNAPLIAALKNSGFTTMASRYIHVTDARNEEIFTTRILKSDLKLLREAPYQLIEGDEVPVEDYPKLLALYHSLYITQHSPRNPVVTQAYMQALIEKKLLSFKIVKQGDLYKGVAGYTVKNGIFQCPFFGYEKKDPDHNLVYRLLSTALILEARKRGVVFNQSAGASFYKSIRRSQGCFEYNAIYTKHLPLKQRAGWATLKTFINAVAPPFMKKY